MESSQQTEAAAPSGGGTRPTPPAPAPGFGTELRGRFRYRLIKRLGRGAFGSVYFARCVDHDTRRDDSPPEGVAIKILRTSKGQAMQMLRRELSALLAIQHDRIPRVYDWSLEGEHAFVVMQHFSCGSLRDVWAQKTVEEEAVWHLLEDLLAALDVAHRGSILHLDIKPANVLLDGRGGYVLTDFGVSQASRIDGNLLPFSVGTRGYQAPEQRNERFDQYDLRTDLWGAGATAWAFATGINLAEREDLCRDPDGDSIYGLPPLSQLRLSCSPELESVVMSMLTLDPSKRPGSVVEVLDRVREHRSGHAPLPNSPLSQRSALAPEEVSELIDTLVDPVLVAICQRPRFREYIVRFEDGQLLCDEGERTYEAFLLLRGTAVIYRGGKEVKRIEREGTFLCEVATLTSMPRSVRISAAGCVYAMVLNAADLERFVTSTPALGLRVIRSMAQRLSRLAGDAHPRRLD